MKNKKLLLDALAKSSMNLSGRLEENKDQGSNASSKSLIESLINSLIAVPRKSENKNQIQKSSKKIIKNKSKLAGAKFRWINEKLYTISSHDALQLFKSNPDMFINYHDGFDTQVQQWPQNPVDIFITKLASKEPGTVVADMGCGTAKLAKSLSDQLIIHSFDLSAANQYITVADISNVPLQDETVNVVVFSLSLMGVNYIDFIVEARRILKIGYVIYNL